MAARPRKVVTLSIAAMVAFVSMASVPLVARADTSPITYHGDRVITTPHVYLDFWGGEWSSGFPNGGYSAQQVENYIQTYFNNVGGSNWMNTLTQYFWVDQYGNKYYITNPTNQLKGVWIDSRAVPAGFTKSDVWYEAYGYAIPHFNDIGDYNAVYFILTGPNRTPSDLGPNCGYHDRAPFNGHQYAYAYVPYQPTAPGCFVNQVNNNDSFGHGQLDGYSITGGHEYAEAITDPNIGNGVGWWDHYWCTHGGTWFSSCPFPNDWSYDEIGDKCGYNEPNGPQETPTFNNVLLGNQYFAAQGLWNDAAGSCALGPIYTPRTPIPPSPCSYRASTQFLVLASTTVTLGNEQINFKLERIVDPNYNWCFQTHVTMSWANGSQPPPLGSFDINVRDSCNHSIQGSAWLSDHSYSSSEQYVNTGWHIAYGPCNIVWGADDADGQNGSQVVDQNGNVVNYWQPYYRATYVTYGTF